MKTLHRVGLTTALVFLSTLKSAGQSKIDVQLSVQLPAESARGGEPFSFTAQVKNRGLGKATDVILVADPNNQLFVISSALPGKGTCEEQSGSWRCKFGDMRAEETVTVTFGGKLHEYDSQADGVLPMGNGDVLNKRPSSKDASDARARAAEAAARLAEVLRDASGKNSDAVTDGTTALAYLSAAPDTDEENTDNNHATVRVNVRPSRNQPPQVSIVSPQPEAVLVRPARKQTRFQFMIEASDPDGTIDKVLVTDPKDTIIPVPGPGYWTFMYQGKSYTAVELENYLKANPQPKHSARPVGKNTFAYTVTDPPWGRNRLTVEVTDNGDRSHAAWIDFFVRGDATIEIVSPKQDQIVEPGSTLVVETVTTLNEGPIKEIVLIGVGSAKNERAPLELVSRQGNVYRHRYVWKDVPEDSVYTSVQAILIESSGAITHSDGVGFLPRRVSTLKFANIRDGQVFDRPKQIEIQLNEPNRSMGEQYALFIDGKYRSSIFQGYIWHSPEPGTHTIQVVVRLVGSSAEISRSEMITIHVK